MNKLNQILLLALLAQVALVAAMSAAKDEAQVEPATKVFDNFDPDKVTAIEVLGTKGDGSNEAQKSVKLSKNGSSWGVASADGYPVKADKIDEFLKSVKKLTARGSVSSKAAYHKKLEVAEDKYQRKVNLSHDGKELTFFVGSSPGFKKVHLRKAGSDDVLLTEGLVSYDIGQRAADWLDRTYLKVNDGDAWSVGITNAKGTLQLDKGVAGDWALLGAKKPLKKSTVDDLVRKATSLNLDEAMGKTDKPEYGFGAPLATVELVTGTSTIAGVPPPMTSKQNFKVGAKVGNNYYLKSSASEYVVQVASWSVEPLINKTAADLYEDEKK